jgi:ribulose-phosphate 3-epimerase
MDKLDIMLLMSVNPGFGGQQFIPSALAKLRAARQLIDDSGLAIRLEIDGGVGPANIADIARAGADTFVAGSAIFKANGGAVTGTGTGAERYAAAIGDLRCALAEVGQ